MKELNQEQELELRMYFFVPYNISEIQKGIQAGHALGRYCLKYGRHDPNHIIWEFLEKFETWIILNGGTTNDERDFEAIPAGSLNLIGDQLLENNIEFSYFIEPDLNHALTALCIICDERVFNRKDFPDFPDYIIEKMDLKDSKFIQTKVKSLEDLEQMYPDTYKEWVGFLGGVKNVFLRKLIENKKMA
jgi:hypothetical protein